MATATRKVPTGRSGGKKEEAAVGPKRGRPGKFPELVSRQLLGLFRDVSSGKFISLVELAEIFGVSVQTVRKWTLTGQLPAATLREEEDRRLYVAKPELAKKIEEALYAQGL